MSISQGCSQKSRCYGLLHTRLCSEGGGELRAPVTVDFREGRGSGRLYSAWASTEEDLGKGFRMKKTEAWQWVPLQALLFYDLHNHKVEQGAKDTPKHHTEAHSSGN